MKTYDHVPRWLGEDDHAAQLLRDDWDLDVVMDVVERAAIYRHDAGAGDLASEIQSTLDYITRAPKSALNTEGKTT